MTPTPDPERMKALGAIAALAAGLSLREATVPALTQLHHDLPAMRAHTERLDSTSLRGYLAVLGVTAAKAEGDGLAPDDLDELAAAYATVFLGVTPEAVAPVESVYLGADGNLYDGPYFDVTDLYHRHGFTEPEGFLEPSDHLAVELSFLAHLIDRAAADPSGGAELYQAALEFRDRHLARWVPRFQVDADRVTNNAFYLAVVGVAAVVAAAKVEQR